MALLNEIKVLKPNHFEYQTPGWWLYQLSEPYRTQALTNFKNATLYEQNKKEIRYTLYDALHTAFTWSDTPEGHNYWSNMYDKLKNNQPLTEIKVLKPNPFKPNTPEWWFHQLPEPYRKQALTNFKNSDKYEENKDGKFSSLESALFITFNWADTPEGHDYWDDLHTKLENDEEQLQEIKVIKPNPFEPKTIEWWLYQLPEPYRKQALTNFKNSPKYEENKNTKVDSILTALQRAFKRKTSPEGSYYWWDLYYKLYDNEPITEIKISNPLNKTLHSSEINYLKDKIISYIKFELERDNKYIIDFYLDNYIYISVFKKFIVEQMIFSNYEINKNGQDILITFKNKNIINKKDVLNYIESNPALKKYLLDTFYKFYWETININEILKKLINNIVEDSVEHKEKIPKSVFHYYVSDIYDYMDVMSVVENNDFEGFLNKEFKKADLINENKMKKLINESLIIYEIEVLIKVEREANKVDIYNEIRAIEGVVVVKVEQNDYLNTLESDKTEYSLLHMKYLVTSDPIESVKEIRHRVIVTNRISGLLKFIPRLKTLEKKTII